MRVAILIAVIAMSFCRSRQLDSDGIGFCLSDTDFAGQQPPLREAIGWHIGYERRVKETTCCALQPRADLLRKRSDIREFKHELIMRIDVLEKRGALALPATSPGEVNSYLRKTDACYGALMDLYHDVHRAVELSR